MENQILDNDLNNPANSGLSPETLSLLGEIKKWTKFLSILGFVMIGFMVLAGLGAGTVMSKLGQGNGMSTVLFAVIYLCLAAIYFFPVYYLFKFSSHLGKALQQNSSGDLTAAFSSLKSHYKFFGILAIIFLSIYGIFIFIAIIGGLGSLFS